MTATCIEQAHQPVKAEACAQLLAPALEGAAPVIVDATLGLGGHTELLLKKHPNLRVIGIDRDPQARNLARQRLAPYSQRLEIVAATYGQIKEILAERNITSVDGILADLGVSSIQLDQVERGFSYAQENALLDMRMNNKSGFTAADFLNTSEAKEIAAVLRSYGEEKFAWQIAKNIVKTRQKHPIVTSGQLTEIIKNTIPAPARRKGGNPAKRTFQALRIAVNDELGDLARFLPAAVESLKIGGRLVIESYQSLEDRLVKRTLASGIHPDVPKNLPIVDSRWDPWLADLTKGALKAEPSESASNPRAKSVRLRAVEKLREIPPQAPTPTSIPIDLQTLADISRLNRESTGGKRE